MNGSRVDWALDAAFAVLLTLVVVATALGWLLVAYAAAGWVGAGVMALVLLGVGSFVRSLGR